MISKMIRCLCVSIIFMVIIVICVLSEIGIYINEDGNPILTTHHLRGIDEGGNPILTGTTVDVTNSCENRR